MSACDAAADTVTTEMLRSVMHSRPIANRPECRNPQPACGSEGILTPTDLHVWQRVDVLHVDFERETGVIGVRLRLRSGGISVNDETVALPPHFPWVFSDLASVAAMDMDDRREAAGGWLQANALLKPIYPQGFRVVWYS
jgi:hypothetical protein